MKFIQQFAHFTTAATLVVLMSTTSLTYADDTEIYLNSSSSTGTANILFSLDTSGSMGSTVDENNNGVIDSGERSRIEVLKEAMGIVLDSLPPLNAGLQRYHYYGGPILYPVAALEEEACVIEGNCTVTTATSGTVNVTNTLASTDDDAEQRGSTLIGTVELDRVALDIGERPGGSCSTVNGSVRISSGLDDAESDISEPTDTEYEPTSSDLEIPREGSEQQMVGLRFQNVAIPAGSTVTSASLEFIIDSTPSSYNSPIDVLIAGETILPIQPGAFNASSGSNEPEDRVVTNSTSAIVNWETGEFPSVGDPLETNNIAAILNEMLLDPDWNSGDDMVFFLSKDPTAASGDNGSREVESFEGSASNAPLLKYSYESCASATPEEIRTGLRFTGVSIPQGSTITSARIDFTASTAGSGAPDLQVRVEEADDAAAFTSGSSAPFANRSFVSGPVAWDASSTPALDDPWVVDDIYSTPDLTTAVQNVVNRSGWCGGNALMFMIERNGGANQLRTAYSSEGDSTKAPTLTITYDADNPQSGANGCTRSTIVKNVSSGNNDAEEAADGSVNVSSSDLELVEDGSTQTVGIRFTDIGIAQGATIASAKLIFTADETHSGSTSLTFHGELSEDSVSFSNTTNDITNTSNRPRTSASASATPPAFSAVGQIESFGGIGPIVQEIVNQAGWEPGNAMTFFVSGSGKRVADSYDGDPATAPRLEITFEGTPVSSKKTVRKKLQDLVEGLVQASGTPIAGVMTESAHYFRGEGVRFGRQRGTQSSSYRVSNVSHAASYAANGAVVTYPGDCAENNEADTDCKDQVIQGGTPRYKSPIIAECQSNYLVQLTDGAGYYTGAGKTNTLGQSIDEQALINAFTAEDGDGNAVSMPACNTDTTLSDGSTYSGSSHNECTVKLAKFLHENDQIYSNTQLLQSGTSPIDGVQSLDIYNIGFNLCGSGNITSLNSTGEQVCCVAGGEVAGVCTSPLTDPDRIKVLKAQSDVAGGEYFNANTVDELVAAFTAITGAIVQKSSTFAAPAVSVNTFNRLFSRDEIYFGLFEPSRQQRWEGNLKKYKLCVKADIDGDGTDDCTLGDILDDTLVSAVVDDSAAADDGLFKESARSVWSDAVDGREIAEGGAGNEITDYTNRKIYTDVRAADGQAAMDTPLSDSGFELTEGNWDATATSAIRDQVCPDPSVFTTGSDCEARMLWMLGFDQFDEDEDTSTNTRWWFNDVLHSSPTVITYGKTAGGEFIDKVLVGTNEGGLHFINGSTGEEEWVFMPNAVLPVQQSLYDDSAPAHTYGLDATPVIGFVDENRDGTIDPATDFVGVIIAQRRGGDNMYALDLTPTSTITATSTTVVPKFLWHISPSRTGYSRLGQTWSEPVIARIATPAGAREVMIFGGGYDTDLDTDDGSGIARNFGSEAGNPQQGNAIFVADPSTGDLIFSISGPSSGANIEVADMVHAIPSNVTVFDSDGDGLEDRIYVGDVGGNVWRVDLTGVNPADLTAPEGNSVVGKLAALSTAGTLADERRFFYKPAVVQVIDKTYSDAAGGEFDYVLIGSGNRANPLDTEVKDRFYAIRDINTGKMGDTNSDGVADNYPLVVAGTVKGTPVVNSDLTDVSTATLDATTSGSSLGWFINFDSLPRDGEKVLASSTVIAGTLFFTTYIPDDPTAIADTCSAAEGSSRVYGLNVLSASASLDWDEDGSVTTSGGAGGLDASIEVEGGGISSGVTPILTEDGPIAGLADQKNLGPLADRPRARTYWNETK